MSSLQAIEFFHAECGRIKLNSEGVVGELIWSKKESEWEGKGGN